MQPVMFLVFVCWACVFFLSAAQAEFFFAKAVKKIIDSNFKRWQKVGKTHFKKMFAGSDFFYRDVVPLFSRGRCQENSCQKNILVISK